MHSRPKAAFKTLKPGWVLDEISKSYVTIKQQIDPDMEVLSKAAFPLNDTTRLDLT